MLFSDLGAHIDGFIAVVAHTVCVGGGEVTGRAADVLLAAHNASEAALRLLRNGNEVIEISKSCFAFFMQGPRLVLPAISGETSH